MYAADVLSKVFFPREPGARATLAICERAKERLLRSAMHLVHFAFVTQETAAICETLQFLTPLDEAFVGPVMLVHVFTVSVS